MFLPALPCPVCCAKCRGSRLRIFALPLEMKRRSEKNDGGGGGGVSKCACVKSAFSAVAA